LAAFCDTAPPSIALKSSFIFALFTGESSIVTPFLSLPASSTVSQLTQSFGSCPAAIRSSKNRAFS